MSSVPTTLKRPSNPAQRVRCDGRAMEGSANASPIPIRTRPIVRRVHDGDRVLLWPSALNVGAISANGSDAKAGMRRRSVSVKPML